MDGKYLSEGQFLNLSIEKKQDYIRAIVDLEEINSAISGFVKKNKSEAGAHPKNCTPAPLISQFKQAIKNELCRRQKANKAKEREAENAKLVEDTFKIWDFD